MSSGDALTPGKTGGVGSAIFNLHDNGTLDYQVWIFHKAPQRIKRTNGWQSWNSKLPVGD